MRSKHKLLVFAPLLDSSSCILSDTSSTPNVVWLPLWRPVSLSAYPIYQLSLPRSPPESLASAPTSLPLTQHLSPLWERVNLRSLSPPAPPSAPAVSHSQYAKAMVTLGDIWVP